MTLPTTTSSTSKLIRQIERIEAIPKATKAEASEIADALLARYAGQRANDPEIYYAMLVSAMTGCDLDILRELIHPTLGLRVKFLPSVPEVVDFLATRLNARQQHLDGLRRERLQIAARAPREASTPEEKARAFARWQEVRKGFQASAMAARKASEPRPIQEHVPSKLLEALEGLEKK